FCAQKRHCCRVFSRRRHEFVGGVVNGKRLHISVRSLALWIADGNDQSNRLRSVKLQGLLDPLRQIAYPAEVSSRLLIESGRRCGCRQIRQFEKSGFFWLDIFEERKVPIIPIETQTVCAFGNQPTESIVSFVIRRNFPAECGDERYWAVA